MLFKTNTQQAVGAIGAAVVLPVTVAWATTSWRGELSTATVAVLLAGVVVGVASLGRRSAAIVAAVVATLSFDYFHTLPYYSFTIHETDELLSAATLLFVGLLAAGIQTRSRERQEQVEEGIDEIARIGAVTDLVASARPTDEVIKVVELELVNLLGLRSCRYETAATDGRTALLERTGEVTVGALRWRADRNGLPGPAVDLPVFAQGRPGGRFVLEPEPGRPASFERRIVAVALADQVGASLAMNLIV